MLGSSPHGAGLFQPYSEQTLAQEERDAREGEEEDQRRTEHGRGQEREECWQSDVGAGWQLALLAADRHEIPGRSVEVEAAADCAHVSLPAHQDGAAGAAGQSGKRRRTARISA